MSFENLLNPVIVAESRVPNDLLAAPLRALGQRTNAVEDARVATRTQVGDVNVLILAAGKNSNTKFYMLVRSGSGKAEYVYLGDDKERARSVAQNLIQTGKITKAEAVQGNLFALKSFGGSSASDAMTEEMKARVEAMLAEAWRNHGELMAEWIKALSGDTPQDRRWDEIRKSEEYKVLVKQATESIALRVQRFSDGLISKSEALVGLPEFLANRVASLIDSTLAAKSAQPATSIENGIAGGEKRFALLVDRNGLINVSNIKEEAATS
jgi:hypothetical protein